MFEHDRSPPSRPASVFGFQERNESTYSGDREFARYVREIVFDAPGSFTLVLSP